MEKAWIIGLTLMLISVNISSSSISNADLININYARFEKDILYVGGSGPNNYTTIQSAIDNAVNGDIIFVYNGTYYEHLLIDKAIELIGMDQTTTIIDGQYLYNTHIINITSDNVNIQGFTIQNSGVGGCSGISVNSNICHISDNSILNNDYSGIYIHGSSSYIWIFNNTINNNRLHGIYSDGYSVYIYKNNIEFNGVNSNGDAIWIYTGENNLIYENLISENEDGIVIGFNGGSNIISDNIIERNIYDGIRFWGTDYNKIYRNNIISNGQYGINFWSTSDTNQIYHNNFINNTQNAYELGGNIWYNFTLNEGNFWDDYNGTDDDGDGIGDIPYNIPGGDNEDPYPLMNPFELYYVLNISAPEEVDEGAIFSVIVKSLGGTVISDASVEFNEVTKHTDQNGIVEFTAPQVQTDTYYYITATKNGYLMDIDSILILDILDDFNVHIIVGEIENLTTVDDIILFEAKNLIVVIFYPFGFRFFNSGELIAIKNEYGGFVGLEFILTICEAMIFENN